MDQPAKAQGQPNPLKEQVKSLVKEFGLAAVSKALAEVSQEATSQREWNAEEILAQEG